MLKNKLAILALVLLPSCAGLMQSRGLPSGLRYNIYEQEWAFASPDAELKYNIYENRWEFAE